MKRSSTLLKMIHTKCRGTFYPRSQNLIKRFQVPDDKVSWTVDYPEYLPLDYTDKVILRGPEWADQDIDHVNAKWNSIDGTVNRVSYTGNYSIGSNDGRPLNPLGRTGLRGRGCLGRWGPNHAADPIVTRWKRNEAGEIEVNKTTSLPIIQFVSILRRDCGEWALPGGMVDPGEVFSKTLQREFLEEALDSVGADKAEQVKELFAAGGTEVYRGYVDDPRNTDNAWMETVAVNFHDDAGNRFDNIDLQAGDDAVGVTWKDLSSDLCLYASHVEFLQKVASLLKSHW
jgi:ADP-ribose pyrophosphatase